LIVAATMEAIAAISRLLKNHPATVWLATDADFRVV
jgi:hypothetical protein